MARYERGVNGEGRKRSTWEGQKRSKWEGQSKRGVNGGGGAKEKRCGIGRSKTPTMVDT